MAEKTANPGAKLALDLGPILAFFLTYVLLGEDWRFALGGMEYDRFVAATALFVPLQALATWITKRVTGKLSKMQLATLAIVAVFGGLTIWLNDERFFKMKPTLIYAAASATLGFGLIRGKSYLQLVMDEALPMLPEGWMILTRRVAAFFAALAVANEAVWRTMSTEAWVNFKTFGLTIALFAFFMAQSKLFRTYGTGRGGD